MFKGHVIGLSLLWLLLAFAYYWVFLTVTPAAHLSYQRLMAISDQVQEEQMIEQARTTQQSREQVSKQILYKKESQRLESRLTSDHSELTFHTDENGSELVEQFQGVICALQEVIDDPATDQDKKDSSSKASFPKQYIRCLKADDAVYSYKTGQLEAEKVDIAHYQIPGKSWPLSLDGLHPLLKGYAKRLQLSIFKNIELKAEGFHATFFERDEE